MVVSEEGVVNERTFINKNISMVFISSDRRSCSYDVPLLVFLRFSLSPCHVATTDASKRYNMINATHAMPVLCKTHTKNSFPMYTYRLLAFMLQHNRTYCITTIALHNVLETLHYRCMVQTYEKNICAIFHNTFFNKRNIIKKNIRMVTTSK